MRWQMEIQLCVTFIAIAYLIFAQVLAAEQIVVYHSVDDLYAVVKEGKPVGALFPDQKAFGTLVIPNVLVLLAHAPNPEQAKQFIDFLLRPEIQTLLATGGVETSRETMPPLNSIKSVQVDYGKLVSESKELSQGFLKEWIKTEK
jgi:ABC-type Fe3+ transport system substrate-binding protein